MSPLHTQKQAPQRPSPHPSPIHSTLVIWLYQRVNRLSVTLNTPECIAMDARISAIFGMALSFEARSAFVVTCPEAVSEYLRLIYLRYQQVLRCRNPDIDRKWE